MTPELFTLSWLAQQLDRDRRALARALEGLAPDEETKHGERTERRWYLRRVVEHLIGRAADEDDDQRQRLAAAQAEKHEMDNEERRGHLVDATEARSLWSEHIGAARAKLLSLPTKLGPQLINVADPNTVASRIRTEVYAALDELAEWEPEPTNGASASPANGSHVAQPADADGQQLGGRPATT